jgi:hypothetical protein
MMDGDCSLLTMVGDTSTELACTSSFVTPSGVITYAKNTAIPGETAISCTGGNGALTYSVWPSLSTLGGSLGLSPTSGIITGTAGPAPQSPTLFTITAIDSEAGSAGYFEFYVSVSSGE